MKNPALRQSLLLAGAALLTLAGAASAADCDHKATRSGEADAAGVKRIVIVAEAGDLEVQGKPGAAKVTASGTACASSREQLDLIQLETRRSGDTVTVTAKIDRESKVFGGWNDQASLDLEIAVPDGVELEIEDGSGDTVLRQLGKVRLEDGSGDLKVRQVAGLRLVDGSGDVEIEDSGDLEIEDGSGDLHVRGSRGNVMISEDGSGDIDLQGVAGWVRVRDDGSGSIYVADVRGDFTVDQDGSGEIEHQNVGGKVSLPAED